MKLTKYLNEDKEKFKIGDRVEYILNNKGKTDTKGDYFGLELGMTGNVWDEYGKNDFNNGLKVGVVLVVWDYINGTAHHAIYIRKENLRKIGEMGKHNFYHLGDSSHIEESTKSDAEKIAKMDDEQLERFSKSILGKAFAQGTSDFKIHLKKFPHGNEFVTTYSRKAFEEMKKELVNKMISDGRYGPNTPRAKIEDDINKSYERSIEDGTVIVNEAII